MTSALSFLAGVLSVLSPCVLPLLPIVLGTAASQSRWGPLALGTGLALSFTVVGLFVATVGFAIGMDGQVFRSTGAVLLILVGAVLAVPPFQARVALAAGPVSNWAHERFGGVSGQGWTGQFAVGGLLGAVWSPCVGPTLGAASVLAAGGEDLGQVTVTMLVFGLGAALPLVLLGTISRQALVRWRGRMMAMSSGMKIAMGIVLVITGGLILSSYDKVIETKLVNVLPDWLSELATRF